MIENNEYIDTESGRNPREWESVRLEDIVLKFISGGTPSTKNPDYWNEEIPWMTSSIINGFYVDSGEKYISKSGLENSATHIVPKNNILIATRVGVGKAAVNLLDVAISQDLTGAILDKNKVTQNFLCWSFLSPKIQSQLKSYTRGTTIKGIARVELCKILVHLPPLPEQKKIAEILSSVDNAIEKVDQSIECTEKLKSGLMHLLFAKGIGHKEFNDTEIGRIPRDWEVSTIEQECSLGTGGTPSRNNQEYYAGNVPWVKSTEVNYGIINNTSEALTISGLNNSNAKIYPAGALIVALHGQGTTLRKCAILGIDAAVNQACAVIQSKGRIHIDFLSYWFQKSYGHIRSFSQGANQSNLNMGIISALRFPLPPLPEQKKISEILSTVDKRLDLLRQKTETLARIKKGLMNDLLTGKKRVLKLIADGGEGRK